MKLERIGEQGQASPPQSLVTGSKLKVDSKIAWDVKLTWNMAHIVWSYRSNTTTAVIDPLNSQQ